MKPPLEHAATDLTETVPVGPDLTVDVLIESAAWHTLPDAEDIVRRAIVLAAASSARTCGRNAELSVLLCDDQTIAALNGRWRGQEKPTNVLSFPALPLQGAATNEKAPEPAPKLAPLGDIAIAYETLVREARESGKTPPAHLSHLVVHGFLHLLGYDHETDDEAERMERLERDILARIGITDPYAACDADI
jgi:probable rRNA maturation factor